MLDDVVQGARCPDCGSAMRRSRARWYEQWRKGVSIKRPFRCESCSHRVWRNPPVNGSQQLPWPEHEFGVSLKELIEDLATIDTTRRDKPLRA